MLLTEKIRPEAFKIVSGHFLLNMGFASSWYYYFISEPCHLTAYQISLHHF